MKGMCTQWDLFIQDTLLNHNSRVSLSKVYPNFREQFCILFIWLAEIVDSVLIIEKRVELPLKGGYLF